MILPRILLILLALSLLAPAPVLAAKRPARAPAPALSYHTAFAGLEAGKTDMARQMLSRGQDPVLSKVLRGLLMAQPNNDYSFDDLAGFVTDNPDWPGLKGIMMILEQKIPDSASPAQLVNWFNAHAPLTPSGFSRFIESLESLGQSQKAQQLVKARWTQRTFSNGDEAVFVTRYASYLSAEDHWARLDRLLWENEIVAARAMYPYVGAAYEVLAEARIALSNQTNRAESLLERVPANLQGDAGLAFEQLRWRRKNEDNRGAMDILLSPPSDLVRPDLWWDERNIMARRLMERKDFDGAYRIISQNGLSSGFDFVQAEFLAGFLALRFMERTDLAHRHFSNLLKEANTPISRARGMYWLGRTYEQAAQPQDAHQSYEAAAALSTTYYGQLAIAKLYTDPVIRASSEPPIPANIRSAFFNRDAVRATQKLYAVGEHDRARAFFKAIIDYATKRVDFALALELAYQLQRPDWAVDAAKAANQKNFIITGAAYPVLAMSIPKAPELALTHALIRQESQFKADAGSPVGAQGLMQLMPGTAKDVARKLGMPYSPARLVNADYNVRLGTSFIQQQIDSFDGSYVLALAGYNAGPRRAREWMEMYGDPRSSNVDPVDWIELIPIYETRNYVQRIIENLQFYRARLNKSQAPLKIIEDLKR